MANKLFHAKIDVSKITKEKLFQGSKGTYLDCDIWISDEPDKYGNTLSIVEKQTKNEREGKEKKNYLGNGKEFVFQSRQEVDAEMSPQQESQQESDDDLPF